MDEAWYSCSVKISPEEYVVTGGTESSSSVVAYNVTSGSHTRLPSMSVERYAHGCALVKHGASGETGVLVAGGAGRAGAGRSSEFFSLETGTWRRVGDLTVEREGVRLAVVQGGAVAHCITMRTFSIFFKIT